MAFSSCAFVITLAILFTAGCITTAVSNTFSVDLIHRDSVDSPFYDPSINFSERIGRAIKRSFIKSKLSNDWKTTTYQTRIIPDHGEFLLNISYGNPPQQVLAIADTGSDLSWIQCQPCIHCYNQTAPLFNPKKSSTYKPVDCESKTCEGIRTLEANCTESKSCPYSESYSGGTATNGTIATESLTIGDKVYPHFIFGCGFSDHESDSFRPTWAGIVGLGGGDYSLVMQLWFNGVLPRFSYCLIPFTLKNGIPNKSSKMIFGGDIDIGPDVVSIPLVLFEPKTFYFVTLEGISVGDRRLNVVIDDSKPGTRSKGNMVIDSGTTLTRLPVKLYNEFVAVLRGSIYARTTKDPDMILSLCYCASEVTNLPKVMMHFEGGDVELSRENMFARVNKHIICLAIIPVVDDFAFLGNIAQMNYRIGFDLENNMVSFKRTDCEKL